MLAVLSRMARSSQRLVSPGSSGKTAAHIPISGHSSAVVQLLSNFGLYFLPVNRAKRNNCAQLYESNMDIKFEICVHCPLNCAILKLELRLR